MYTGGGILCRPLTLFGGGLACAAGHHLGCGAGRRRVVDRSPAPVRGSPWTCALCLSPGACQSEPGGCAPFSLTCPFQPVQPPKPYLRAFPAVLRFRDLVVRF